MSDAWPQFPLDRTVWISDQGDLTPFDFFLRSTRRTAPALLLPTGTGLSPRQADIAQIAQGTIHLVRLDMTLAPQLSELLQIGVDRRTAIIFWPPSAEDGRIEHTPISYLPRAGFIARLLDRLERHEPTPASPQKAPVRPHPGAIPPRQIPSEAPVQRQADPPRSVAKRPPSAVQSARNSYRAFFDVQGRLIKPALKSLASWLAKKGIEADLSASTSGTTDVAGTHYEWTLTRGTSAKSNAFHFEMNQSSDDDSVTFTTVITADEKTDNRGSWLFLHVYNDGDKPCGTPLIASSLLESLTVVDGKRPLRAGPQPVDEEGTEGLLDSLRSRARRLPVQVLGTDDTLGPQAITRIFRLAGKWTKSLAGQSHVVVLDPAATIRFNSLVPDEFHANPWTLRTYRPGIALVGTMEARQQREIRTKTLAESPDWKIDRLLVGATRAITQQHPLPREVREIQALLARLERAERVERPRPALTPEPPADQPSLPISTPEPTSPRPVRPQPAESPTDVDQPPVKPSDTSVTDVPPEADPRLRQVHEAILQTFDATELTDEILEDVLALLTEPAQQTDTAAELEQQLLEIQNQHNALIESYAERHEEAELVEAQLLDAQNDLHKKEREIAFLRDQLTKAGAAEAAYSFVDDDPLAGINDIFDVLEQTSQFNYVVATWDEDEVMDLHEIDNYGTVPKLAWSALTVMERYCRAKDKEGYDKGFNHFVEDHGELLTPKRVAMRETSQTMKRWGEERRFKVPEAVDPSGQILMEAHIKLTKDGINSPRMHFFDDTGRTGKIYVGYLGRHLTNTQTTNM